MLMRNLEGQAKSIMIFSEVAHILFVGIDSKRFSKECFSILVHEFFVLAQSIFFGI